MTIDDWLPTMSGFLPEGFGWYEGLPDFRDYTPQTDAVREMLAAVKRPRSRRPNTVDLREYMPPVYNQGALGSSTAQACAALYAYFQRRAYGRLNPPSRLFLYKVTRKLLGVSGDTGADLRTTLRAMVTFGMPPERYRPYVPERFDDEPEPFEFNFVEAFRSLSYIRLDARNENGSQTLETVRHFLAAGFPCVFGFGVPASISRDGDIPYRPTFDSLLGGQAVVAVGYDDRRLVSTRGALLVRNSWGREWGEQGYGWLPYVYVKEQLAASFWTLLNPGWLESGEFRRPKL